MVNMVSFEKAKHCHWNEKENIASVVNLAPDDTKRFSAHKKTIKPASTKFVQTNVNKFNSLPFY
jgi:hypothetical protein